MRLQRTILIIDQDSDLGTILGSYFSTQGYRVQFTTRVFEAMKKLSNQKYKHVFLDPSLKPDNFHLVIDELNNAKAMNYKTPLTIMTFDQNILIPMSHIRRIDSILLKPFALAEIAHKVSG